MVNVEAPEHSSAMGSRSLSEEVARVSDTIAACDRLCLLSARSLLQCIDGVGPGQITFIPSVSRNLKSLRRAQGGETGLAGGVEPHCTTTAQCVAALQSVVPVMGRFRLGARDAKDLPFHPINQSSMKAFEPDKLKKSARAIIDDCLLTPRGEHADPQQTYQKILDSDFFRYLHPFTASQVLRAIAPSNGVYGSVWWGSLFIVLWFLNRRGGLPHSYPNIQATNSPGTAFLTSKCVEAIEAVVQVFGRRRNRFKELLEALKNLRDVSGARKTLSQYESLDKSHCYAIRRLELEIRHSVRDLCLDGSFPSVYKKWNSALEKHERDNDQPTDNFASTVVKSFVDAKSSEIDRLQRVADANVAYLAHLFGHVRKIHDIIRYRLLFSKEEAEDDRLHPETISLEEFNNYKTELPDWLCSQDYWESTAEAVQTQDFAEITDSGRPQLEMLEMHWHRHRDACASALKTVKVFKHYLGNILDQFRNEKNKDVDTFIANFDTATKRIEVLRLHLAKDKETGARWADVLMNRHLVAAVTGAVTEFDPSELAHALRVACQGDRRIDLDLILTALHLLCDAQRPDGSWTSQQPFFWKQSGMSTTTLSIDTANAIVATVNALLQYPERHGTNIEECSARLQRVYLTLDRFMRWLSAGIQSFPKPPALPASDESSEGADSEPPLYGWCSDRVQEQGRIHCWVTAAALEFLVNFRKMQQGRINGALRAAFLSYHPDELRRLSAVAPTDLDRMSDVGNRSSESGEQAPIMLQLSHLMQAHKDAEFFEGP